MHREAETVPGSQTKKIRPAGQWHSTLLWQLLHFPNVLIFSSLSPSLPLSLCSNPSFGNFLSVCDNSIRLQTGGGETERERGEGVVSKKEEKRKEFLLSALQEEGKNAPFFYHLSLSFFLGGNIQIYFSYPCLVCVRWKACRIINKNFNMYIQSLFSLTSYIVTTHRLMISSLSKSSQILSTWRNDMYRITQEPIFASNLQNFLRYILTFSK